MTLNLDLLTVNNLKVKKAHNFQSFSILDNINFKLEKGERLGVVGESGCGKSMMAFSIIGLLPDNMVASGEIIFGKNLIGLSEKKMCKIRGNKISMIFQEPMTALNPVLTIGVQVSESLRLHKNLSRHESQKEATKILERVGLPSQKFPLSTFPHQLSGGQRQRVVIAIAIACKPELIIADEPTTSLDVTIQEQILDLISELVFEENMSLILITHDLGIVAENTDHMMVMYAGRIVEKGPTKKVFEKLSHPYTRGLFSSIPNYNSPKISQTYKIDEFPKKRLPAIDGRVPEFWERSIGCDFFDRCSRAKNNCSKKIPNEKKLDNDHYSSCFYPF